MLSELSAVAFCGHILAAAGLGSAHMAAGHGDELGQKCENSALNSWCLVSGTWNICSCTIDWMRLNFKISGVLKGVHEFMFGSADFFFSPDRYLLALQ